MGRTSGWHTKAKANMGMVYAVCKTPCHCTHVSLNTKTQKKHLWYRSILYLWVYSEHLGATVRVHVMSVVVDVGMSDRFIWMHVCQRAIGWEFFEWTWNLKLLIDDLGTNDKWNYVKMYIFAFWQMLIQSDLHCIIIIYKKAFIRPWRVMQW